MRSGKRHSEHGRSARPAATPVLAPHLQPDHATAPTDFRRPTPATEQTHEGRDERLLGLPAANTATPQRHATRALLDRTTGSLWEANPPRRIGDPEDPHAFLCGRLMSSEMHNTGAAAAAREGSASGRCGGAPTTCTRGCPQGHSLPSTRDPHSAGLHRSGQPSVRNWSRTRNLCEAAGMRSNVLAAAGTPNTTTTRRDPKIFWPDICQIRSTLARNRPTLAQIREDSGRCRPT